MFKLRIGVFRPPINASTPIEAAMLAGNQYLWMPSIMEGCYRTVDDIDIFYLVSLGDVPESHIEWIENGS